MCKTKSHIGHMPVNGLTELDVGHNLQLINSCGRWLLKLKIVGVKCKWLKVKGDNLHFPPFFFLNPTHYEMTQTNDNFDNENTLSFFLCSYPSYSCASNLPPKQIKVPHKQAINVFDSRINTNYVLKCLY